MTLTAKAYATFGVMLLTLILVAGQARASECTDLKPRLVRHSGHIRGSRN